MVSYVIVHIGGGKKQRIQTTPSMILRQVVDTICKRRNDHHPERYILRKGNYDLDLSWTIHNAGITSGSQLDLIKRFRGTSAASSHFCIALQLGAMTNNSISLAASTSLRKALLVLEQATEGYRKSAQCTNQLLFSTSNNNNSSIFANRRSFSKSGREFPKYAPLPQRSFKSSTIAVSASFESGTETGVVRVAVPDMNAKLDKDHMMSDYDDNSDVNINEGLGIWSFDLVSQRSSFSPSTTQLSSSPVFTTSSSSNINTSALPTAPSFFVPAPIAQPNNDKPLSGNVSIPTPYTVPAPSLTSRTGHVASVCRDGHLPSSGGGGGNGSDGESNRQTPTQDISAAMIEANQEIRQRLEQQTQEALTDRVRCLSKNSDSSSDKDRFLRSMRVDGNNPAKKNQQQDDIVRQIALRVSRMLKEAEERGETAPDYQTLIAQEIAKEQQGGMLAL